jgi:hypothetical protein
MCAELESGSRVPEVSVPHRDSGPLSEACRPALCRALCLFHARPMSRVVAGYRIRCWKGLIAAMQQVPSSPFGLTSTAS